MTDPQPTLSRRHLGKKLQTYRERTGYSGADVADALGYRRNTIWRIEQAQQGTRKPVIESLGKLYQLSPEETSELLTLCVKSNERGWWEDHKHGVSPKWGLFAEQEQAASALFYWEPELIPGLVQTVEYMKAVQAAQKPLAPEAAKAIREFKVQRQDRIWARRRGPKNKMLIGDAAMRHLARLSPEVSGPQLQRLREIAGRPNVEIRIACGLHRAMYGAFAILAPKKSAQSDPPFVYIEGLDGARYVEDKHVVSDYQEAFNASFANGIPIEEYIDNDR